MKKKKVLIVASALTCAFAAAAHLEWVGYKYFDRANGSNILCTIDPTCRTLTSGEIKLTQKYFSTSVDPKSVKIFNRPFMHLFGHDSTGMAPNGNIYFADENDYSDDFSKEGEDSDKFAHEVTHVAQFQAGMNLPKQAFFTWLRHAFNYSNAYHYNIGAPDYYPDMNLEQQAKVMQDYVRMREFFERTTTMGQGLSTLKHPMRFPLLGEEWAKERCREMMRYEVKMSPVFRIKPDELCLPPSKQKAQHFGIKAPS